MILDMSQKFERIESTLAKLLKVLEGLKLRLTLVAMVARMPSGHQSNPLPIVRLPLLPPRLKFILNANPNLSHLISSILSPKPHFLPKRTGSIHGPAPLSSQSCYPTENNCRPIGLLQASGYKPPHIRTPPFALFNPQSTILPSRFDREACLHSSYADSCVVEPNRLRDIQMQLPAPVPYTLNHFPPRCSSSRLPAILFARA